MNGSQGKIVDYEGDDHDEDALAQKNGMLKPTRGLYSYVGKYAEEKEDQARSFIERALAKRWPIVQFNNGRKKTIYPYCQLTELGATKPYSYIGRVQIPLLRAWAITVHKSQGMTLEHVIVDLARSFETEMVYVALSRAKGLDGLKVRSLPDDLGQGLNREDREFYEERFGLSVEE